jgi:hypothetical protein
MGVIYSSTLPEEVGERRNAFHWLIANRPDLVKAAAVRFHRYLTAELRKKWGTGTTHQSTTEFVATLREILRNNFHLFEPAQVITFRGLETREEHQLPENEKNWLISLLDREHVIPYKNN